PRLLCQGSGAADRIVVEVSDLGRHEAADLSLGPTRSEKRAVQSPSPGYTSITVEPASARVKRINADCLEGGYMMSSNVTRPVRSPHQSAGRISRGRGASELRQSAVHRNLAGGHEAAVRRRQEGGHRTDLRRIGHALH